MSPWAGSWELSEDASTDPEISRKNDPLYKITGLQIQEKEFEKKMLRAERWPTLNLAAKWDLNRDIYVHTDRVMAGVSGKWNIWDFGEARGTQIHAKEHEIEEKKWEGVIEVRDHENEIRKNFHEIRATREKVRLSESLVRECEELYKNEKTKSVAGNAALPSSWILSWRWRKPVPKTSNRSRNAGSSSQNLEGRSRLAVWKHSFKGLSGRKPNELFLQARHQRWVTPQTRTVLFLGGCVLITVAAVRLVSSTLVITRETQLVSFLWVAGFGFLFFNVAYQFVLCLCHLFIRKPPVLKEAYVSKFQGGACLSGPK